MTDPAHTFDGTDRLTLALYGRTSKPQDYIGGADANMLHDAAALIRVYGDILRAIQADLVMAQNATNPSGMITVTHAYVDAQIEKITHCKRTATFNNLADWTSL